VAVPGLSLHAQQNSQVLGRWIVCLAQQRHCLIVVISLRMLPKPSAADRVRGSDTCVDAQRHVHIGDLSLLLCLICDQAGGV
jgi:hypothetical protein